MNWLLTTLAFGWGLHDVSHVCLHPPDVTDSWIPSTYYDMEGMAMTAPDRWFPGADSVSLFESMSFNTIGVVVRAHAVPTTLNKPFRQLEKHYTFNPDDDGYRTWTIHSRRKFPEFIMLLQDDSSDVLLLATCGKK